MNGLLHIGKERWMNMKEEMDYHELNALKVKIAVRFSLLPLFIGLTVLLPAGTFRFWHVYAYLAILIVPMIFVIRYFIKKNPRFLERRLTMKEKEPQQKAVAWISTIVFLIGFMLPGFDYRFSWSHVPIYVVILSDILGLLGYMIIFHVFKVNSYASRVVEVSEDQQVISAGPYRIVRHPMYLGTLIMFLATPLALGSYWAIIPFAGLPIILVLRIFNEEKVLSAQLQDYNEYCSKTRYRLIPFIW